MQLTFLFFGSRPDVKWALCRQMGITKAIAKLAPELTGRPAIDDLASFGESLETFRREGLEVIGLEGDQFDMTSVKLGLPDRDRVIERYQRMLDNMGTLGVGLLCYNFMATGWYRTHTAVEERGGALVSRFHYDTALRQPDTIYGQVEAGKIWDNYAYFLERVLPVAEASGVTMALHPDDPPISPVNGIARILTSESAVARAMALSESRAHKMTFCQGTFTTMQADVAAMIHKYGRDGRIAFVHIRDVVGGPTDFRETFHDNGPTDMLAMMKIYKEVGFDGPVRSDHVPTMAGETNENVGYGMLGNLFGIGYMRGIMEGAGIQLT